mmetsp:Transcript_5361/g.15324  ORF Transcript_5361/g.15324 Transcript_5361/m.15324 type:complete len:202 (+) Transcript_5361:304-909(+)
MGSAHDLDQHSFAHRGTVWRCDKVQQSNVLVALSGLCRTENHTVGSDPTKFFFFEVGHNHDTLARKLLWGEPRPDSGANLSRHCLTHVDLLHDQFFRIRVPLGTDNLAHPEIDEGYLTLDRGCAMSHAACNAPRDTTECRTSDRGNTCGPTQNSRHQASRAHSLHEKRLPLKISDRNGQKRFPRDKHLHKRHVHATNTFKS